MITRRKLVTSALTASGAGALAAGGAGRTMARESNSNVPAGLPLDPVAQNRAYVKMIGSTAPERVIFKTRGVVYAVEPSGVTALFGIRGAEQSWWRPLDDGSFHSFTGVLTFYTDLETGDFIDNFDNPLTGENVVLTPSFIRHKEGVIYTPQGHYFPSMKKLFPDFYKDKPLKLDWVRDGDRIRLHGSANLPPSLPQPNQESASIFADASEVLDPSLSRANATSSGWNIMAWARYLNMGARPGHLIWHFDALKVDNPDDLGLDYLTRGRAFTDRFDESPETDEGLTFFERRGRSS